MRKNTIDTFKAWQAGKVFKSGGAAIWTDGVNLFSYGTQIVTVDGTRAVKFNANKYSCTTSNHQNSIRELLDRNGIPYVLDKD